MFAPFRLTRLLFLGLAACAVTWAMAASALAVPADTPGDTATGDRPAFKVVPGDVKSPEHVTPPAFKAVQGDIKSDADRARAVPPPTPAEPVRVTVPADDDTGTVALFLSIAAILTALGAVTLTVTRSSGRALGT